jgi:hypothetical protein
MLSIKKPETIIITLIIIVVGVIIFNLVISIPTRNHSLEIDALKDPESLVVNSRVVLKNSGLQPLSDVSIVYDNNLKFNETISTIRPGETVILSPPAGTSLKTVHVKTNEGLDIVKEFRSPIKLPGMIGS